MPHIPHSREEQDGPADGVQDGRGGDDVRRRGKSKPEMLQVTSTIAIDESELDERFVRASGPGGQNVNKVATAVELRFDVGHSSTIPGEVRERLRTIARGRITADGVLVIDARRHRTQAQNRDDARQRLVALIRQAAVRPKRRRKTSPTAGSIERRVRSKRQRSEIKHGRGRVRGDD